MDQIIQAIFSLEKIAGVGIAADILLSTSRMLIQHGAVQTLQIAAGAKSLFAGRLQHHHRQLRIGGPCAQLVIQQIHHFQRYRIQRLFDIQRGDADAFAVIGRQFFKQGWRCDGGYIYFCVHWLLQTAGRFCKKAFTPSF